MDRSDEKSIRLAVEEAQPESVKCIEPHRVLRKLDWRLLPFVSWLYLLAFMDRTNVGNAKIAGLTTDLHLTGVQFNLTSAMFFIPYCLLDIPANVALKYFRPSRWIPMIMFLWGVILLSMAFVKDYAGLMVTRVLMGVAEAGLFPGVSFYLCLWYPRFAQAQRLAIFLSASSLAGAFGGLLAYAIEHMDGIAGLAGWSWLFILEGLLTVAVALLSTAYMEDYPETASFLSEEERAWLIETLRIDTAGSSKEIKLRYIVQALRDPHSYLLAAIDFFIVLPLFAFALFLPTIIVGLGYSSLHAQLLTIPPSVCGCVFTIIYGIASDRLGVRGPLVLLGSLFSLTGYVMLFATDKPLVGYIATLIAAAGLYPSSACIIAWTSGNAGGDIKRGAMIALVGGIGNSAAIASSFIYRSQDSPRYLPGHETNIGCCCVLALLTVITMLRFWRVNRKKEAYCLREGIDPNRFEEFADMGDRSPLYQYTL